VGIWERLRRRSAGERHEEAGELEEAVAAYSREGRGEDAARVLSTLADLAGEARGALELLARARRLVPGESEAGKGLARRYGRIRLDLARRSGAMLPSELSAIGAELEAAGDVAGARDALRLAGDTEGETRLLVAHGEIDALEETLSAEQDAARRAIRLKDALREIAALDAAGQRVRAIEVSRRYDAPELREAGRAIEQRLVRPPGLRMELPDMVARLALGATVVVGRREADVIVSSPLVSRHHLRLFRAGDGTCQVEDLGAANGTVLSGARLSGAIPIRGELSLLMGGEVPCVLAPFGDGVRIDVGSETTIAPLGPAIVGRFAIAIARDVYRLTSMADGPAPLLGRATVAEGIDLAIGDEVREARDGPCVLRVIA
jgi:hypothetical protein